VRLADFVLYEDPKKPTPTLVTTGANVAELFSTDTRLETVMDGIVVIRPPES